MKPFILVCFISYFGYVLGAIECQHNQNKEIAIVQLSFDGVEARHSGVGTIVLQTQQILRELNHRKDLFFKLFLISGKYSSILPEYSPSILKKNRKECRETGGDVYLIPITLNNQRFGEPSQWKELCQGGAKHCLDIIKNHPYTVIFAHDTAYAQLAIELKKLEQQSPTNNPYQLIWIPHATGWNYNGHTEKGNALWPARHDWEFKAFQVAKDLQYRIGVISNSIKNEICAPPFDVDQEVLFPFKTGILLDYLLDDLSYEEIENKLLEYQIPIDKRLIFSVGRASPIKGLDISLELFTHLKTLYSDIHLVLLAPRSDHMPEYLDILKNRIEKEKLPITLIDYFDPYLANYLYQWEKTYLTTFFSRADTHPLIIMEARANPKNSIVLASDRGGIPEQIHHGLDGFICSIDGLDSIIKEKQELESPTMTTMIQMAKDILDMPKEMRQLIIARGKNLIQTKYNLRLNLLDNLSRCCQLDFSSNLEFIKALKQAYGFKGDTFIKTMNIGLVNPPLYIENENKAFILKQCLYKPQLLSARLDIIETMKKDGFKGFPLFYRNQQKEWLTLIGDKHYYLMEFIPSNNQPIDFLQIIKMTGLLHENFQKINAPSLVQSKHREYNKRAHLFFDPWFHQYYPKIVTHSSWSKILSLSQYYASEEFALEYENLPHQLIHGDNNQTNAINSEGQFFFIDIDTIGYDCRLLDLASYFRFGGFYNYINYLQQHKLIPYLDTHYSPKLTDAEKKALNKIVGFSHLEFLSWCLEQLKKASNNEDIKKEAIFKDLIQTYISQITILLNSGDLFHVSN